MHGNAKGIVLGPKIDSQGNSDPTNFDVTGDFGGTVQSWDLNLYKEYLKRATPNLESGIKEQLLIMVEIKEVTI